jgi:hypothetical protein
MDIAIIIIIIIIIHTYYCYSVRSIVINYSQVVSIIVCVERSL